MSSSALALEELHPAAAEAGQGPCSSSLERQFQDALRLVDQAPAHPGRTAVFDVVLPEDAQQYRTMNKMAIVGLRVIGDNLDRTRPRDLYFSARSGGKVLNTMTPFAEFAPNPETDPNESAYREKLGKAGSREAFFLVPLRLLLADGELGVRFKSRADHLKLGTLPITQSVSYVTSDKKPHEDPRGHVQPEPVARLLKTYYCLEAGG